MSQYEELKAGLLDTKLGIFFGLGSSAFAAIESLEHKLDDRDIEYNGCSTLLDATERAVESLEEQLATVTAQRDLLKEALGTMVSTYPLAEAHKTGTPPRTFGCHHYAESCDLCKGLVDRWKAHNKAQEALAPLKGE